MRELFTLGELYVSDFIKDGEISRCGEVEMKMMMNDDGSVRLEKIPDLHTMYGKYWYRSGINTTMMKELKSIVDSINSVLKIKENDVWVDIACNDGTLLSYVDKSLIRIGIDPADDSFKKESEKNADLIIQDFFSAKSYNESKFGSNKAKVVTSIAMFYDLEKPEDFIKDVYDILDNDGLWVMQLSYTPLMIKQMAFDNICHEHVYYYSLFNIKSLLEKNGFKIVDCQLNDINGGSFRVYIMKDISNVKKFSTQPYRDVCQFRIESLLEYEKSLKMDSVETWTNFYNDILKLKEQTVSFIKSEKAKGKKIWCYGASTKGNTLLQYFGLDHTLIDGIAERSIYKWGLKTVGTNIPIYSEDDMRKANPDYLLVLPWHFINEFVERESEYLKGGGKFITPCPKFEIIGY
jgi:NDP-4-keto-2,6-dideoxyhexose 3-C-methyltransferase